MHKIIGMLMPYGEEAFIQDMKNYNNKKKTHAIKKLHDQYTKQYIETRQYIELLHNTYILLEKFTPQDLMQSIASIKKFLISTTLKHDSLMQQARLIKVSQSDRITPSFIYNTYNNAFQNGIPKIDNFITPYSINLIQNFNNKLFSYLHKNNLMSDVTLNTTKITIMDCINKIKSLNAIGKNINNKSKVNFTNAASAVFKEHSETIKQYALQQKIPIIKKPWEDQNIANNIAIFNKQVSQLDKLYEICNQKMFGINKLELNQAILHSKHALNNLTKAIKDIQNISLGIAWTQDVSINKDLRKKEYLYSANKSFYIKLLESVRNNDLAKLYQKVANSNIEILQLLKNNRVSFYKLTSGEINELKNISFKPDQETNELINSIISTIDKKDQNKEHTINFIKNISYTSKDFGETLRQLNSISNNMAISFDYYLNDTSYRLYSDFSKFLQKKQHEIKNEINSSDIYSIQTTNENKKKRLI